MSSTAKHILQKGAACQRCKERKRVKSLKPATAQPIERPAPAEAVAPSSPWANQIYTSLHESSTSLPPPPSPALAVASSTLPSPSTSSLYPVSDPVYATPLPAPVALPPPNQELPIFLDYCAAPLPSPMSDLLGASPVSYNLSSPASSFSLPSSEDYMSGSSLTSSPFSLCDDLDYALASANVDLPDLALPATPAWYPSTDPFSTAFGITTHGQGTFLPTGQNGNETIALPLFSL
ncbi:uncharacterized protein JCM10292_007110 [Rhodotorula paludigena]|uniref:uncharacterized protein n=1 Tax=Rhodotorula paludigena TaxID=86838 RepID=UPI003181C54A